ncbi:hypothetical protein vBKpnAMK4_00058 [Klebsiella phage vB_Kpn_AM_K4]|nr:hypothetical protein HS371_36 [Klebsiella phage vB_KpP_HS37]
MDYVNRRWATKMACKNRAHTYSIKKAQIPELIKAIVSNVEEGLSGITVKVGELDYSCIRWAKERGFELAKATDNRIIIFWEYDGFTKSKFYDKINGSYRNLTTKSEPTQPKEETRY